jgi:asparagine synthase (glutamine-hydrolysing)
MSVQFGRWSFNREPANPLYVQKVRALLSPYAPDGLTVKTPGSLTVIFGAFHTTTESNRECQPYESQSGDCIMWDGRLDNRNDCLAWLGIENVAATDIEIAARAYLRWGTNSFSRLLGDWAMSIWDSAAQCLVLAKDFLGSRHLYYSIEKGHVTWSTILDPLVVLKSRSLAVCEEYAAGWLGSFPKSTLTPYEGILAVPPSAVALIRQDTVTVEEYWKFDPGNILRLRTDAEYEECFRERIRLSVRRRLHSKNPVVAELSGGMDSSSIVCVADQLLAEAPSAAPRLDTISYYDDSEPNWNERPYFTQVEEHRGRKGWHIDATPSETSGGDLENKSFLAMPSSLRTDSGFSRRFAECLASAPYRVLLSGVGGDEVTGGVPTPLPELADLLARFEWLRFGRQMTRWSLAKKKPIHQVMLHVAGAFLPPFPGKGDLPVWVKPRFAQRYRDALCGYPQRLKLLGARPSFQANMFALEALRRQFSCTPTPSRPTFEKRYPFLDREFLAFCYAVPREQFVRPHQRRSLLRRAMAGIVPDEILDRKRKAFVLRRLTTAISAAIQGVAESGGEFLSADLGIIEPALLLDTMHAAARGENVPLVPLARILDFERWLQNLAHPVTLAEAPRIRSLDSPDANRLRYPRILGREQLTRRGGD